MHLWGGEGEDEIDGEVENEDGPDGEMRGSMEGEVKAYIRSPGTDLDNRPNSFLPTSKPLLDFINVSKTNILRKRPNNAMSCLIL